jgi:cytochrome c
LLIYGQIPPEENRFEKEVLVENLNEPMEMAVLPNEDVLFIERHGAVKLYDHVTKMTTEIAKIEVSTKYTNPEDGSQSEAEDGLLGLSIDPDFEANKWVYLYYSPAGKEPKNVLARYQLNENGLNLKSGKILLEIPTQRTNCCHTGGSIAWDADKNLYLSTGDNTSPRESDGYSPLDERPGRSAFDAQTSAANTNDLRGKILRIHPEADGSYTIPEGNLFPKGTPKTRPEIYTMGHRNPFRISVDKKNGFLYWGDVGPDAGKDSIGRGPAAEDEFGQARKAGNFGWPYFVGNNKPFWDFDFETNSSGEQFSPEHPLNDSPNNTGLAELPPAQNAFIWYPTTPSKRFPALESGGKSAMAGPVYHSDEFPNAERPFPDYYNNRLFIYEWIRDWIITVKMNSKGDYARMERFLPNLKMDHPIDMEFGPNGDLYILEYGQGWFMGNPESKLVRIAYNGGNRKPIVVASVDKLAGATPLQVNFSSKGTLDYDKDSLNYEWVISDRLNNYLAKFSEPNPSYTFEKTGKYKATLTVTDTAGNKETKELSISVGNEPPVVNLKLLEGNKTFFFPDKSIKYKVEVNDKEDGSLEKKTIKANTVKISANYQDALDNNPPPQGHQKAPNTYTAGKSLIEKSDCRACHFVDNKSIGPSFTLIAKKYSTNTQAVDYLSNKIIKGGSGVWGNVPMNAHPTIGLPEAEQIVQYILSLDKPNKVPVAMPTEGTVTVTLPKGADANKGVYRLWASYTDKGSNGMSPLTDAKSVILNNPTLIMGNADEASKENMNYKMGELNLLIVTTPNTYAMFKNIDLSHIQAMTMVVAAPIQQLNSSGGTIEVHINAEDGPLIGKTEFIEPSNDDVFSATKPPTPVIVSLSPTTGFHDIYFVFRNEKAKGALFVPISVTVIPE